MPSVAMNGGVFIFAVSVPEIVPQIAPVPMAASTPSHIGRCQYVRKTPQITAVKVINVPTDRSMPPVMMTKVDAMASTPLTAVACRMPRMLSICMNAGDAKLKNTSSRMRLAKASIFCNAVGEKMRAFRPLRRRAPVSAEESDCTVIASSRGSRRFQGLALRGQMHDALLRRFFRTEFAGNAALAHHHDAVAHAQNLRQLRRNHHDCLALVR